MSDAQHVTEADAAIPDATNAAALVLIPRIG